MTVIVHKRLDLTPSSATGDGSRDTNVSGDAVTVERSLTESPKSS